MALKDKREKGRIKAYVVIGTIPIILAFIAFLILIKRIGRQNFEAISALINGHLSLFAMCTYIWVTDTFILPLSPMFVFPMLIQYPWYIAIPATAAASALGGISSYFIGRLLYKIGFVRRASEKAREKWGSYIDRYGTLFVLAGSILPLPFSTICMAAGVMHHNALKVSLSSCTRVLRMAIYYYMFYLGLLAA